MLLREDDRGVLAIGQASHAWLSGQLARAWGNERFGALEPLDEVLLAAEQHDVGMAGWDTSPALDPQTGLPYSFMAMPLESHMHVWLEGPRRMISQSRYAALLVSMHGSRLYRRRDLDRLSPTDAAAVRAYLAEQEALQRRLIAALRGDPVSAPTATDALIERNSLLIWTWDYLSLALCLDWARATAKATPTADGQVDLELTPGSEPGVLHLEPWPLAARSVSVHCEGRRLDARFGTDQEMHEALERAPWETVEAVLRPA